MNKAAFSLEKYRFDKVTIDFSNKTSNDLDISFEPSGKFDFQTSSYELNFSFIAHNDNLESPFVKVECIALFKFDEKIDFENIPTYFYRNSIAIIFPYLRAFVSTVTLQANIPPIVLPTMNLSALEAPLKENTIQV
ncbi:MAG: protein-export chaperone SecB [Flavobacterium sp.]|jgi:preprotein translocase subunit SecB|nr:protein-export chaperone SecB [Flavobacterium sp.]